MNAKRSVLRALVRAALSCAVASSAIAVDLGRPDAHAPIGVMADHVHSQGGLMLSYRYMRMNMEGMRDGTTRLSSQDVFNAGFAVTPTRMDMDMHMWGAMLGVHDRLTLVAMVPYVSLSMDHVTMGGGRFTTESRGLGDVTFGGLIKLLDSEKHAAHIGLGLGAPSGSVEESDLVFGTRIRLPYPMQLGSGSWSFIPSATWTSQLGRFSFGGQASGILRMNENDQDYTLGHRANVTGWASYRITDGLSASLRLAFDSEGNIDGADPVIGGPVPTANPRLQGGKRLDFGAGANYLFRGGALKGFRLALEVLVPTWQDLDGPQLEVDWNVVTGLQYAF